uniref:Glycerophosphodiester phosphodiesterase domain containing 5a n=1 Tax=Oryzias latipes TaxID=8090 RepID=A0A3P9J2Z0_ORYLA
MCLTLLLFLGDFDFFFLNRHLTLTAALCFLPSGSVHGSLYCAVPSCCSSFGPTSGWLLKMISMTSTGESLWCPFNFGTVKIRKAVSDMSGDPTNTWKMTELVFVHTPGWCTIVLESGRMKQFPSLHPPPWDSAMSASYWSVIPHRAVTCSCRCFDSLNVSCFSDFSTFPYIFGTTTQSVLGSQGAVKSFDIVALFILVSVWALALSVFSSQIGVLATLLITISGIVSVDDIWEDELDILLISFQSTAPFLHIGALVSVTALSWMVAAYVVRKERSNFQLMVLVIYFVSLLAVCLAPITFTCPCIMDRHTLKARPAIIGRRGAPMLAPENSILSFHRALQLGASTLEADVTISMDGVPFLMRDQTLKRTTDVSRVFPARQFQDASFFNWTEIRSLNAGTWFLQSDPYWTVRTLTPKDRSRIANLTVCSLVEMLRLSARANCSAWLNIHKPPPEHPRFRSWFMDTLRVLQRAGMSAKRVTWAPDTDRGRVRGLQQATNEKLSLEEIRQRGITSVRLHYSKISHRDIQEYLANNVSVTIYPVNGPWLYSLLWCSGVPSVSSDAPQVLRKVPYPIWLMSRGAYSFIWICSDLVSLAVVVGIFCFQKWRMGGMQRCNPEQIMLCAVGRRPSPDVNIMKEKLILSELGSGLGSTEDLCVCPENGHVRYSPGGFAH